MSTLNERIKSKRKELGLTQKELADMLSISDKTVSRWESGNQMPDAILIPDLAQHLQISLNELYGIAENSPTQTNENSNVEETLLKKELQLTLTYKITIIVSIFIFHFGACWLIHSNPFIDEHQPARTTGIVIFLIGCTLLLITEILFQIIFRNKRIYSPIYLYTNITYSGFSTILLSYILLTLFPLFQTFLFSYLYELTTVGIVILFEIIMLWRKNELKKLGISINKKTTIITIIFCIISIILLLGLFLFFNIYFDKANITVAEQLVNMVYGTSLYRLEYLINLCAYFGISLLLYSTLIINYIELNTKIKKLTNHF